MKLAVQLYQDEDGVWIAARVAEVKEKHPKRRSETSRMRPNFVFRFEPS